MPRKTPAPRRPPAQTARQAEREAALKDRPLVEDIRLLGRILGEVIHEQEGKEAFDLIERVRQLSVAYRLKQDSRAGTVLDRLLKNLSGDQTVSVIRAFSYFSHLANIAEDRHHVRRRAHHEAAGHLQEGSLAMCFERLHKDGQHAPDIAAVLDKAYISPVLTAHPTEVQRRSILDAERAIAEFIGVRDELQSESALAENEELMRARITQLWQTRMLRNAKLSVGDEIENALSYYPATFLRQIPKLYRDIERALPGHAVPPFLRMGHWIGGDRDGNPNVNAATLRAALSRQAETALRFYLTEVHTLGAELSVSQMLAPCSEAMLALAEASPDHSEHRSDEPYRRALIGMYARL
ncbi:MAG: phosphoenolpyruvate carboxylase, partial [Rubrivivax sp.]